jgi:hypothetical protein
MKELARWTSTIDHNSIHLDLINKTLPDTGLWLRETNGFRKWTSCNFSSVLILHGIRGSGKTMLTSALIEQYLTEQRASIDKPPSTALDQKQNKNAIGPQKSYEAL